jgi:O-antigen/teichoic acid export membrane protein
LILVPSAFVTDAGLRASGRLAWIGLAQALRVLAYAALAVAVVRDAEDALPAAWCLVAAEVCGAAVPLAWHISMHGVPRLRLRRRAWAAVARRGAIAGLIRFGRVSLYGADLLALGWWAGPALGDYAAARRVVFGFVALGLVLPAAVAPAIARRWAAGAHLARAIIEESLVRTWALSVPAAVVLMVAAGGWMALLFGERYRQGGPWLALIAARLPWLLTASIAQTALVACRRERWVLDQMIVLLVLALVLLPVSVAWAGPWGAGWASLAIEVVAAIGGWRRLRALGLAPAWNGRRPGARGVAS